MGAALNAIPTFEAVSGHLSFVWAARGPARC